MIELGGQGLLLHWPVNPTIKSRKELMRTCKAAGCGKLAAGYSTLCDNHRKTKSRHGHPLQTAVRRRELEPYEKAVKRWLETRSSPEAWNILEDHWKALTASCGAYRERVGHGRPYQKNIRQACETILRVDAEKHHREAIIRVLAMGYLRYSQPRRFQSEQAYHFQVARQFRSLTDASVGIHWDHEAGRTKRVYRDVSPRTLKALWNKLLEAKLPIYGEMIGKADMEERSRRTYKLDEVKRALLGATAAGSEAPQ